ncbi:hypothetical protein [Silanimonas sp.]|uniref:hypothetical protein n=1 Tax=Silanimonas sp. TaxID=1929290 RepID=UPI0022C7D3B7|nr:hypothetical protein [Silanimonas sp.]MCZ8164252.1 hypothetical protein [Silanimonas sp.]
MSLKRRTLLVITLMAVAGVALFAARESDLGMAEALADFPIVESPPIAPRADDSARAHAPVEGTALAAIKQSPNFVAALNDLARIYGVDSIEYSHYFGRLTQACRRSRSLLATNVRLEAGVGATLEAANALQPACAPLFDPQGNVQSPTGHFSPLMAAATNFVVEDSDGTRRLPVDSLPALEALARLQQGTTSAEILDAALVYWDAYPDSVRAIRLAQRLDDRTFNEMALLAGRLVECDLAGGCAARSFPVLEFCVQYGCPVNQSLGEAMRSALDDARFGTAVALYSELTIVRLRGAPPT